LFSPTDGIPGLDSLKEETKSEPEQMETSTNDQVKYF